MSDVSDHNSLGLENRNRKLALAAALLGMAMLGAAYAAVPLYDLFCRVTGYAGTTQVASAAPSTVADRMVTIRFDASLSRAMPWTFEAPAEPIEIKVGDTGLAFYRATNLTDQTITGTATYNVSPAKAGFYFSKIDCFCFTEQVLEPGQTVDMPVSFFVDPEILDDREMADVKTITLSYTFFKVQQETFKVQQGTRAKSASPSTSPRG